jgi:uncharacterized membrane protein (UPF0127 family)
MFKKEIPQNYGMVFYYKTPKIISLWMKNTFIPLDMVFVKENGIVSYVHKGAIPHDLTPIRSPEPCRYVIELMAGEADRLGIEKGLTAVLAQ